MSELFIPKVNFVATLACNLRCKLCAAYSPLYPKPYHPTIDEWCRYIYRFFEVVDCAGTVCFSGGEPFLRKDLASLANAVYKYSDQISFVDILTNGTIIPDDDIVFSLSQFGEKLRVIVDDYGDHLSVNADKVAVKLGSLDKAKIEIRKQNADNMYFGGWVDYGISSSSTNRGMKYARKVFQKCAVPQKHNYCIQLVCGVLYPCVQTRRIIELGMAPPSPDEVFDLFDSRYSDDELRERISAVYSVDSLSACAYCNGMCEDSARFIPAEQSPPHVFDNDCK